MRISIVFAFISVCGQCHLSGFDDRHGSRSICHLIVALDFAPARRDSIRSDIFAYNAAQLIAHCILTQRAAYLCRQLRIFLSIRLALVVRFDGHCLRIYFQRSIYCSYRKLICNISISIFNNNGFLVLNIIRIDPCIYFDGVVCGKTGHGICGTINRKCISLYA